MTSLHAWPRLNYWLAAVVLLALLAHLATIGSPDHARSTPRIASANHMVGMPHEVAPPMAPVPGAPVHPEWDVCGLVATLPVVGTAAAIVISLVTFGERGPLLGNLTRVCRAWDLFPPPSVNRQAVLQLFRL